MLIFFEKKLQTYVKKAKAKLLTPAVKN